ncbi:MAG: DUF2089 family protein [Candidatus Delongbacteria bacterium]
MDSWERLTHWTQGRACHVERVRLDEEDVAIEGRFELPPLARLKADDQVFVAAFIRAHGSLKQMEESFGISYPTIKNRLRRLSEELTFLDIQVQQVAAPAAERAAAGVGKLLDGLESGELSVKEVLDRLGRPGTDPARTQAQDEEQ